MLNWFKTLVYGTELPPEIVPALVPDLVPVDPFKLRVGVLTREADGIFKDPGYGGAKRQYVYAQLIKEFPAMHRRDISFMIEASLREHIS